MMAEHLLSYPYRSIVAANAALSCQAHVLKGVSSADFESANISFGLLSLGNVINGNASEAVRMAQRAIHLNPDNVEAWGLFSLSSFAQGLFSSFLFINSSISVIFQ
jgi:hypothetical protein